jgi:hypothetical protein
MSIQSIVQAWLRLIETEWDQQRQELLTWADPGCGLSRRHALENAWGDMLFLVFAVRGSACRDDVSPLVPLAEAAVHEIAAEHDGEESLSWAPLKAGDLVNALQSVGCSVSTATMQTMTGWLPYIETFRDDVLASFHWKLGFTALALGDRRVCYRIAGYNADGSIPFEAGKTFQFNVHGFLGHLAGAVERGARASDVTPAWQDLLRSFPELLAAGAMDIGNLLWIARIIHHHIDGQPLAGVADFLHASIWQAAGLRS